MRKHHISYTVVAIVFILSLVFIENNNSNNNVSALSYESSVGIGFTFNPTLSVSLSSSDLIISNLTPGSSENSNSINVSVATNASYGYTLSANANSDYLTHSNNIDTFNSIALSADLSSLDDSEDSNIWGYSTSLDNGSTWSNYNGLSSSSGTTLLDKDNNTSSSVDFKIAAKASSTQASGIYTNTINFIAVSKVAPMSLLDSFIASGAEQLNGYFKMQDMTHDICQNVDIEESELQLIDVRDNKTYWVAKLKDGNCWMTQNLDLDLSNSVALTSETSDIDPESYGTTIYTAETGYSKDEATGIVSWLPSTIDENGTQRANTINMVWNNDNTSATIPGWSNSYYNPYSADAGNKYRYTNPSSYNENTYDSLESCVNNNGDISGCQHTHFGNYYNWPATVASNNASTSTNSSIYGNSICPKNWGVPPKIYDNMLQLQNVKGQYGSNYIEENNTNIGFNNLRTTPLYFAQFGRIVSDGSLNRLGESGFYWTNTVYSVHDTDSYILYYVARSINPASSGAKSNGYPVRCITK